jgi:hypothetical protein
MRGCFTSASMIMMDKEPVRSHDLTIIPDCESCKGPVGPVERRSMHRNDGCPTKQGITYREGHECINSPTHVLRPHSHSPLTLDLSFCSCVDGRLLEKTFKHSVSSR